MFAGLLSWVVTPTPQGCFNPGETADVVQGIKLRPPKMDPGFKPSFGTDLDRHESWRGG